MRFSFCAKFSLKEVFPGIKKVTLMTKKFVTTLLSLYKVLCWIFIWFVVRSLWKTESRNPKAANKKCLEKNKFRPAIISEPYFLFHWKMFFQDIENKYRSSLLLFYSTGKWFSREVEKSFYCLNSQVSWQILLIFLRFLPSIRQIWQIELEFCISYTLKINRKLEKLVK